MERLKNKNRQLIFYFLLLGITVFTMTLTQTCNNKRLSPVEQGNSGSDTLDVAIIYGPLSYYIYDDTLGGINYDLLKKFEIETKTPVRLWPVGSISESMEKLETGTFDLLASVAADYSIKKRFPTSESIYLDRLVLVRNDNNTVFKGKNFSALDLANDTIHIVSGAPSKARINNLAKEIGEPIEIIEEPELTEELLCIKIAKGETRQGIVNEQTALKMKKEYPNLTFDNPVSFTQFQVWVMSPEDSVKNLKINRWLKEAENNGILKGIQEKYIKEDEEE